MTCTSCGAAVSDNAKFCGGCGTAITNPPSAACPSCGRAAREGQRFCGGCGASLLSPPPVAVVARDHVDTTEHPVVEDPESAPIVSLTREIAWDVESSALLDRPSASLLTDPAPTEEPAAPSATCTICGAPTEAARETCDDCAPRPDERPQTGTQDGAFCATCGGQVPPAAKFCPLCGASRTESAPAGGPRPGQAPARHEVLAEDAARRLDQVSPEAGELARQLSRQLSAPGVLTATLAAAGGLAASLVLGLICALALPDMSYIGRFGSGSGLATETLRLAAGSTLARVHHLGVIVPLLFVVAPVGGTAIGAYLQAARTAAMPARQRMLWGAAAGVPLAILMVIVAVVAGGDLEGLDVSFSIGSVIFYSLLWGAAGGVAGTWYAIHKTAPDTEQEMLPARAQRPVRTLGGVLRPLLALLVVLSVLSTMVWEVQTIKGEQSAKLGRSTGTALVENALFAADWGLAATGAGMFSSFTSAPFPPSDSGVVKFQEHFSDDSASARIFAYRDAVPVYVFIVGLIVLVLLPIAFALYTGFATARRIGAHTPAIAAAAGAGAGATWAVVLVILNAFVGSEFLVGGSLFGMSLLVAGVSGAVGGVLSLAPASPQSRLGERPHA
jgi:hypothetical protein